MTNEENQPEVFDVDRIRELIELMKEHELSEIDLKQVDRRIRLRRGGDAPAMIGYPAMQAPMPAATAAATPAPAAASTDAAADDDANATFITSPMVGSFYCRPKPDAEPFVKVGDIVQPDTIVCIVEAMKTFNELPAGVSGKIVAMLVNDEDPVDVNKPLFKVVPA